MKWIGSLAAILVLGAAALALWVRLAPSDPAAWHAMPGAVTDRDLAGGGYARGGRGRGRIGAA